MATFTEHYELIKPGAADHYDIADWNENMDTIDGALGAQAAALGEMNGKMGEAADTGDDTLFGKLNRIATNTAGGAAAGLTAIKSIQRVVFNSLKSTAKNIEIQRVVPENCIVLMERLYDADNHGANKFIYTLEAEQLTLEHFGSSMTTLVVGLWIVEFM